MGFTWHIIHHYNKSINNKQSLISTNNKSLYSSGCDFAIAKRCCVRPKAERSSAQAVAKAELQAALSATEENREESFYVSQISLLLSELSIQPRMCLRFNKAGDEVSCSPLHHEHVRTRPKRSIWSNKLLRLSARAFCTRKRVTYPAPPFTVCLFMFDLIAVFVEGVAAAPVVRIRLHRTLRLFSAA